MSNIKRKIRKRNQKTIPRNHSKTSNMNRNESKLTKFIILLILPILVTVLGSIATNIAHRLLFKPTIWKTNIYTDNLLEDYYYPQNIYVSSNKEEFVVTNRECYFCITILNNYEQDLMFSGLEIEIEQYPINYPIIEVYSQNIDDIYCANICNLLDEDEVKELKINVTDKDKYIENVIGDITKYIDVLYSNECKLIELFSISNLESQINEPEINPILKITDENNNILEYQLGKIVLKNDNIAPKEIPKMGVVNYFFYDITNDVIQNNKVITFYKYKSFIPSEEIFDIDFSISSKIPCAIKISINFVLNGKEYTEDMGNVIFYYPTCNEIEYDYWEEDEDLNKYK